jgi:inorganic pyrophosphatase
MEVNVIVEILDDRRAWSRRQILTVPAHDPRYASLQDFDDVPAHVTAEIGHFFDIYKELEPGKDTDIRGWQNCATAVEVIRASFDRREH